MAELTLVDGAGTITKVPVSEFVTTVGLMVAACAGLAGVVTLMA